MNYLGAYRTQAHSLGNSRIFGQAHTRMDLREELNFIASLRLVSSGLAALCRKRRAIRVETTNESSQPNITKPRRPPSDGAALHMIPKSLCDLSERWIPALNIAPVETPPSLAILEFCGDAQTFAALAQTHVASRALMSQQLIWRALYMARWPRAFGFIGQMWRQAYYDRDARFLRVLGWRRLWERRV